MENVAAAGVITEELEGCVPIFIAVLMVTEELVANEPDDQQPLYART